MVFMFLRVSADGFLLLAIQNTTEEDLNNIRFFFLLFTPSLSSVTIPRRTLMLMFKRFSSVLELSWYLMQEGQMPVLMLYDDFCSLQSFLPTKVRGHLLGS